MVYLPLMKARHDRAMHDQQVSVNAAISGLTFS